MKKLKILLIICSICMTKGVLAADISVSLSCPTSVYVGEKITCKINSNTIDGSLSGIKANYEILNGSYVSFSSSASWVLYASTSAGFVLGNTSGGVTGSNLLGTLIVNPDKGAGSSVNVKLNSINASDTDYNDYDIVDKSASINIIEKPLVQEPEKSNTDSTKKEEVYLDTLSVEGYNLFFNKNIYEYELEVESNVESVNVNATSKNNKVTGAGKLQLNNNENLFKIIVTGKESSKTYTLKIKKAEVINDVVLNDAEQVEKALDKYDLVSINLKIGFDDLIAYQNVLDKVKGKNKKIIYNIYDGDKLEYSFIFDGTDMDFILTNMSLEISFASKKVSNIVSDKDSIILNMMYKSYFPNGTTLKIYDVKNSNKKNIKLYRVNAEDNLELVQSGVNFEKEEVSLNLEKGDMYVLTNAQIETNYSIIILIQSIVIIVAILECVYVTYKYVKLKMKN